MHEFGSDIVLDLLQYYQFDYIGWVRGQHDARPEFVLCMVEGLPADSRYKIACLPNPRDAHIDAVRYEASTAHTNTLISQFMLSFAPKEVKAEDIMPPWVETKAKATGRSVRDVPDAEGGSSGVLSKMAALFSGGGG